MARNRSGSIRNRDGMIYARVTYFDSDGKRKEKWRRAESRSHARELIKQIIRDLDDHGPGILDAGKMTFNKLADDYEQTYLIPPQYVDDRKVAGQRGWVKYRSMLQPLRDFFGKRRIQSIKYVDLERYRLSRLNTKTYRGTKRSIATVNRELSLLRRLLNFAVRSGWMIRNPFEAGEPIIRPGDEKPRDRILTSEEEYRLLMACVGTRAHLRPIIITALDTGMRRGELLQLKWSDINFADKLIAVRAFTTKTMRARTLAMTPRVENELLLLYEQSTKDPDGLVFGISLTIQKSFEAARKAAGLQDVRFHDLRHTAATRLVQGHVPILEVGRVLGHTQANTTYRYVNANVETARRAADVLASFSESKENSEEPAVIH